MRSVGLKTAVDNGDFAGLAIELEEDRTPSVVVRIADCQKLNDQRLARLDVDGKLFARFETVQESWSWQDAWSANCCWCRAKSSKTCG